MNTKPIDQARTPDLRGSWAALQRAALRARQIAAQTGTAIVVSEAGTLRHIYPHLSREMGQEEREYCVGI